MKDEEYVDFEGLNQQGDGSYADVVQGFSVMWSKTSDEVMITHPDGRTLKVKRGEATSLSYMLSKNL